MNATRSMLLFTLLTAGSVLWAGDTLEGYLGARFGMTPAQVRASLPADGISLVTDETLPDERVLRAERDRGWTLTDLVYVFPAPTWRLALVIEIFPGLTERERLRQALRQQFGEPAGEDVSARLLAQMEGNLNVRPNGLTLWVLDVQGRDRMVRLLEYPGHMRVEYMDAMLISGAD